MADAGAFCFYDRPEEMAAAVAEFLGSE